eukprot:179064_1
MGNEQLQFLQQIYCTSACCGGDPPVDLLIQSDERKQLMNRSSETSITSQPIIIKAHYNSTSISLHDLPTIDLKDPNYVFIKSFKQRSVSSSYRSLDLSGLHTRKVTSVPLFKVISEDASFSNDADMLWQTITDDRSFDWNSNSSLSAFEMIQMAKPPLLNIYMNDIIYYRSRDTGDDFVIGASAYMHIMKSEYREGVYRYNLNTSAYQMLSELPDILSNYQSYLAFDHDNERLHFLFGDGNTWVKYDIKQGLWYFMSTPEDYGNQYRIKRVMNAKCLVLNHTPHIIGQGQHYVFDEEVDRFVKYPLTSRDGFDPKNFVHLHALNRLYIFGGLGQQDLEHDTSNISRLGNISFLGAASMCLEMSNDIWYLEISDIEDEDITWNLHQLKLPYRMNKLDYHIVVCYEYLVFVFYHTSHEVWCLDLKHDCLVKVERLCEIKLGQFTQMIATKDNLIHCICLDSFGPIHIKLDAQQLIPGEIFDLYSRPCADLICGYIKEKCKYKISFKIKQHIFEHYPVFL